MNSSGIVIYEVKNDVKAYEMMENDPAVNKGIKTAELFPYSVALYRKIKN